MQDDRLTVFFLYMETTQHSFESVYKKDMLFFDDVQKLVKALEAWLK